MKPELRPQNEGLTMTVLGCGDLGIALLTGLFKFKSLKPPSEASKEGKSQDRNLPSRLPTRFNVCVRGSAAAKTIRDALDQFEANLEVFENKDIAAIKEAEVVMLAGSLADLDESFCEALEGKLIISIAAGISRQRILNALSRGVSSNGDKFTVVRAAPNIAAAVQESITAIERSYPPGQEKMEVVDWIFESVGKVVYISEYDMDAGTAFCSSGLAMCTLVTESLAAGAMRSGMPPDEAYIMAAQVLKGAAGLIQNGEHPALLRDRSLATGNGAAVGLQVLEEGAVRGTISKATTAAVEASKAAYKY
ncbi:hypothetical protein CERZMDRAFT_35505 [Cercospora zeae-maydis SCOH1-5]|uniref:Uncharacterized protein n=1 Tax=Cercospora zeae-maydis SCOH1-5 TaxID=717836 RepID=A0A6A6FPF1_9PEZI|nr:hypothetical protein CERZMDRAFT_35505 [Cercospora zeae-maydis SCOH1-5]